MNQTTVTIKEGKDLTEKELKAVNEGKSREWELPTMSEEEKNKHLFVLVKDGGGTILSQGQMYPLFNVKVDGKYFDILEVGGIIANEKGKGYGRILIEAIIEYLKEEKKSGIGFAGERVKGFYETCGFTISYELLSRFPNYQELTGDKEDYVFYFDSEDQFIETVLAHPKEQIYLPK